MTNSIALQAKGLTKYYDDGNERLDILRGIDITVYRGEMLAVMGASGSGKSTLMHILGLLDYPSEGEVWIDGLEVSKLAESKRSQIRNQKLGFVYQFHHLLPEFNALDNVAMPLILRRESRQTAREQAHETLKRVGLAERVFHKPGQLSGGERQRVALARALVTKPICVLADEPTGNLDTETAEHMFTLLKEMNELYETAFVIVTHDPNLGAQATRCLQMEKGYLTTIR